jgi:hypothetical protein
VHRELVAAVGLGRQRRDLGLRKVAHRVAQRVDVLTELEVQAGQVHGGLLGSKVGGLTFT